MGTYLQSDRVVEPSILRIGRCAVLRPNAITLLGFLTCSLSLSQPPSGPSGLPYRFLLVIGDQWKDPASTVIEGGGEFNTTAALLKSWGLPFEIWRLDQQRLDKYHLLDRDGRPRYGTIIWDASAEQARDQGVGVVSDMVTSDGVNLVVLGDALSVPSISALAGVRYISGFISRDNPVVSREHFITRGLNGDLLPAGAYWPGCDVVAENATPVMTRGPHPFLTVRQPDGGGRVVWLGVDRQGNQLQRQVARELFKRALVWAQGYALYADYSKTVILFMDDPGTSDKTYLPYWSYLTPSEETIRKSLIGPLRQYHAVLTPDVTTGYVDRKSQRILNPWRQDRVADELVPSRLHDFASTKRGLDAGVREGVFEIQAHGWTHILPDLDSPPGPFWTAPMDGVASYNWYQEFGDPEIRKREVPAIWQAFHMRRAIECLQEDFGIRPQFIMVPGSGHGTSYPNHSARIAAQMGFGLSYFGGAEYLDPEMVLSLEPIVIYRTWAYDRPFLEIPWTPDAPYFLLFHDRDVSLDPVWPERLLEHLGGGLHYMTASEYSAYMHAKVEGDGIALAIDYDPYYCRFFASAKSKWVLHLSDEVRRAAAPGTPEKRIIDIPVGAGHHTIPMR